MPEHLDAVCIVKHRRAIRLGEATGKPGKRIGHHLAGDNAIGRQHQETGSGTDPADQRPFAGLAGLDRHFARRGNRGLLGVATDCQLGHQDRQGKQDDAADIDQHEGRATILPRHERETPKIAQTDG